jgi:hypothetical protein
MRPSPQYVQFWATSAPLKPDRQGPLPAAAGGCAPAANPKSVPSHCSVAADEGSIAASCRMPSPQIVHCAAAPGARHFVVIVAAHGHVPVPTPVQHGSGVPAPVHAELFRHSLHFPFTHASAWSVAPQSALVVQSMVGTLP